MSTSTTPTTSSTSQPSSGSQSGSSTQQSQSGGLSQAALATLGASLYRVDTAHNDQKRIEALSNYSKALFIALGGTYPPRS